MSLLTLLSYTVLFLFSRRYQFCTPKSSTQPLYRNSIITYWWVYRTCNPLLHKENELSYVYLKFINLLLILIWVYRTYNPLKENEVSYVSLKFINLLLILIFLFTRRHPFWPPFSTLPPCTNNIASNWYPVCKNIKSSQSTHKKYCC